MRQIRQRNSLRGSPPIALTTSLRCLYSPDSGGARHDDKNHACDFRTRTDRAKLELRPGFLSRQNCAHHRRRQRRRRLRYLFSGDGAPYGPAYSRQPSPAGRKHDRRGHVDRRKILAQQRQARRPHVRHFQRRADSRAGAGHEGHRLRCARAAVHRRAGAGQHGLRAAQRKRCQQCRPVVRVEVAAQARRSQSGEQRERRTPHGQRRSQPSASSCRWLQRHGRGAHGRRRRRAAGRLLGMGVHAGELGKRT